MVDIVEIQRVIARYFGVAHDVNSPSVLITAVASRKDVVIHLMTMLHTIHLYLQVAAAFLSILEMIVPCQVLLKLVLRIAPTMVDAIIH